MNTHYNRTFSYMVLSDTRSRVRMTALQDSKRRTARSKEATRRAQDERCKRSVATIQARNRGGAVQIHRWIEHEWPDHRP